MIPESKLDPNVSASLDTEGLSDLSISCTDCHELFTWTAGEQAFFREKALQNPPKRCKACKKAKNKRIEAVHEAAAQGKRYRTQMTVKCAECSIETTVPFFPSQKRPVYCRACFLKKDR